MIRASAAGRVGEVVVSVSRFERRFGGVVERFKATVLKTVVVKATVGSNPTPSATILRSGCEK